MQTKFLVGTGIANGHGAGKLFHIEAETPFHAIAELKRQIDARRRVRKHDLIGMHMVNSLDRGELNFIVFDSERTHIVAGELAGEFQEPATRRLAASLSAMIPPVLYYELPDDGTATPSSISRTWCCEE